MIQSRLNRMVLLATLMAVFGCAGSINTRRLSVDTDKTATGLRFFKTRKVEVVVYHVFVPTQGTTPDAEKRIERVGDSLVATVPDMDQLWEANYQSNLFANQTVTLNINDKGGLKTLGLQSNNGNTPPLLGALQAAQKGLETARDFDKTRQQAEIDALNRRTNLIKAKKDLETALKGK